MTFSELNLTSPLLNALDELGFKNTTPIQEKAFSIIMSGRDVCGIAQTGTGKTLAYLLPILRQMKFKKDHLPEVLIIVPTRELVVQVVETVEALCQYLNFIVLGVYGGVNMRPQATAIQNGADIVVGTPGRVMDLIYNGYFKTRGIKKLVIDEMDEMLELGFRRQIADLLDLLPEKRQNLLFSATLSADVEQLMDTFFNHPEKIEAAAAGTPLDQIEQISYSVPNFNTKVNLLIHLLKDPQFTKVLIFISTKALADLLFERLETLFPEKIAVIHSNKDQKKRFLTVNQFQDEAIPYLIATDIVSRGIDISEVSHVINMDVPENKENYIHRIGRTGRADKEGIAITFFNEDENVYKEEIEEYMQMEIPVAPFPDEVELSTEMIPEEMPTVRMKNYLPKVKISEEGGGAFHEKKAKNLKVNKRITYKDRMAQKAAKKSQKQRKRKGR